MKLFLYLLCSTFILGVGFNRADAQIGVRNLCPPVEIEPRGASFTPGGILLTTFDRSSIWVYDIDQGSRYPLPETFPCPANCRLSPDARWFIYFNDLTNAFNRMRLDGTQRSYIVDGAAQLEYWSEDTWLVWTPGRSAYLLSPDGSREDLDVRGVTSVQPGGRYGVRLEPTGDNFRRALVNLMNPAQTVDLGLDLPYFDDAAWSPDGTRLAFVQPVLAPGEDVPSGSEIWLISPNDSAPTQITRLTEVYGEARINGLASGALSWSPDGTRLAFWVTDMTGGDPLTDSLNAEIHVLDVNTRLITKYCRFNTTAHTPNPPRLVWSPDGTHLAFGADLPDDTRATLLLALNTQTGVFTILSEGLYPALGQAEVAAWGLRP